MQVHRVAKRAEEDEAGRHRGIQASEEDEGWDHEGEGNLLVEIIQRSKRRSRDILVASVGVDDASDNGEDDDFGNRAGP